MYTKKIREEKQRQFAAERAQELEKEKETITA
jgi:hypothetical protein